MKTTIRYEKLFNLGHFENEKIGLEIELDIEDNAEGEKELELCYKNLREKVHAFHEQSREQEKIKQLEKEQEKIKQLEEELSKLKSQMQAGAVFIETKVE